jgi:beta-galactosidase GanA
MKTRLAAMAGLLAMAGMPLAAQAQDSRFTSDSAGQKVLTVDGKPFLILGIQLNNSSGFAETFHALAPAIRRSHANTVMVPLGWETIEPEEGRFDFSTIDGLIAEARAQKIRVALLWFGSWKNAKMSYAPAWVKRDTQRFPRVEDADHHPIDVLSPSPRPAAMPMPRPLPH